MSTVVFMGTPDFAEGILQSLIDSEFEVIGVFTQPDRPKGRKGLLQAPPVKTCALEHGIPVWQPERIRAGENADILRELAPDFIVVAAFGQIIPQSILDIPRYGCLNVHASLLPRWRGAAPIQWAILSGEEQTGVTIMRMDAGLDTGDIIDMERVSIDPQETGGSLFARLMETGKTLLIRVMRSVEAGEAVYTPQPEVSPTPYAKMLERDMGYLDWSRPAKELERTVRGLYPWPGTWTHLPDGRKLKIWRVCVAENDTEKEAVPGRILCLPGEGLQIACGHGALLLKEVQPEGKKHMEADAFWRGAHLEIGQVLGTGNTAQV